MVTHGNLGNELLATTEAIVGRMQNIHIVSIDASENVDVARKRIQKAVQSADRGRGVLLFTDMLGGTPSDLSLSFLEDLPIEVISGVNLPMLVKLQFLKEDLSLEEAADLIQEYGRKNISVASHLLGARGEIKSNGAGSTQS